MDDLVSAGVEDWSLTSIHDVSSVDESSVVAEQISYYRARAAEYDGWFFRQGRYDRGEDATRRWREQVDEVRDVLRGLPIDGKDVLELAPGTGLWTEEICERVAHLTAVDASSEMIALNRRRLGERVRRVTYVEADLFQWRSARPYDAVIFCFWISHVPARRIDGFLANVAAMLAPGAPVFFLDGLKEHTSTASDHVLPASDDEVMTRRLDDGREFTIIKNYWSAPVLEAKCERAGLRVTIHETADYFQYGVGIRA